MSERIGRLLLSSCLALVLSGGVASAQTWSGYLEASQGGDTVWRPDVTVVQDGNAAAVTIDDRDPYNSPIRVSENSLTIILGGQERELIRQADGNYVAEYSGEFRGTPRDYRLVLAPQ